MNIAIRSDQPLDVRPWYRSDIINVLRSILASTQLLPAQERTAFVDVLSIMCEYFGCELIEDGNQ